MLLSCKRYDFNQSAKSLNADFKAIFNPTWLAPEVVQGKASGTAMDIYSFGSMLF
jgi:serine/threonine protein kinase